MRGSNEQLRSFFEPDGVVIIGASRTEGRPGYCAVENLVRLGYRGRIYPVNPEADEILGLTAFPDIESIPDKVEFAVVLAPAPEVNPSWLRQCVKWGCGWSGPMQSGR